MTLNQHPKLFETSSPLGKYENGAFVFWARVTPKSRKEEIGGFVTDSKDQVMLKIRVTEPPEHNKANLAVIALLSQFFKVPKSKITIVAGLSTPIKKISISEFTKKEADAFLG